MEQRDCRTEHCEEGSVIWFQTFLNLTWTLNDFALCLEAELSVFSYNVLQYQHLWPFAAVVSLLYLWLGS